jgi:hypothetical protein
MSPFGSSAAILLKLEYLPCNRHDKGAASPRFMLSCLTKKVAVFAPQISPQIPLNYTDQRSSIGLFLICKSVLSVFIRGEISFLCKALCHPEFTPHSHVLHRSLTNVAYKSALHQIAKRRSNKRHDRISSAAKLLSPSWRRLNEIVPTNMSFASGFQFCLWPERAQQHKH